MHVMPVKDMVDHVSNDTCVCGPTTQATKRDDGRVDWIVVHHSLDGREQRESKRCPFCATPDSGCPVHRDGDG